MFRYWKENGTFFDKFLKILKIKSIVHEKNIKRTDQTIKENIFRRNLSICLCSELLQADCVKQMSKSNSNDQPEDQECHVNVKISKQLGPAVSFNDNDNPVNENKEEVPIEKIENSSGDNHTSFEEETDEPYINATNDQDQVVHGVLTAEEKSGMLIESAETAVSKLDIKVGCCVLKKLISSECNV